MPVLLPPSLCRNATRVPSGENAGVAWYPLNPINGTTSIFDSCMLARGQYRAQIEALQTKAKQIVAAIQNFPHSSRDTCGAMVPLPATAGASSFDWIGAIKR